MGIVKDTKGDAVVEATILFPIMIMIFAALVLLAVYLPTRAALQQATQYAASVLATEMSDTWLGFNEGSMTHYWETDRDNLPNVYVAIFSNSSRAETRGEDIAIKIETRGLSSKAGELSVECYVVNRLVYKEVVAKATREIPMTTDLSFIGFPKMLTITVMSTAVVHNGDEFMRSIDLAVDFAEFIIEKLGLTDLKEAIGGYMGAVSKFLGL